MLKDPKKSQPADRDDGSGSSPRTSDLSSSEAQVLAEANMIGVAGALARQGLMPFVHSFGVFTTRRPLDQIINAVAYPRLPVRIVGFMPGVSSPGGPGSALSAAGSLTGNSVQVIQAGAVLSRLTLYVGFA